jgi:hypothetical protein
VSWPRAGGAHRVRPQPHTGHRRWGIYGYMHIVIGCNLNIFACVCVCVCMCVHISTVNADSQRDMDRYLVAIEDMYRSRPGILKGRMLCYERAIRTRGRDHMQVHCLPVQAEHVPHAVERFLQIAQEFGLHFHEILVSSSFLTLSPTICTILYMCM